MDWVGLWLLDGLAWVGLGLRSLFSWWVALPYALLVAVLSGKLTAFGLPRVFLPDDDTRRRDRIANGAAVAALLAAIAVVAVLPLGQASKPPTIPPGALAAVFITLVLGVLAALEWSLRPARRAEASSSPEARRKLSTVLAPTQPEVCDFEKGLIGCAIVMGAALFGLAALGPPHWPLHVVAAVFAGLAVLDLVRLGWVEEWSTAAMSTVSLLALVTLVAGLTSYLGLPTGVVLLLGGMLVALASAWRPDPYHLDPRPRAPPNPNPRDSMEPDARAEETPDLGEVEARVRKRLSDPRSVAPEASGHAFDEPGAQPLVLVCCSGGGIRAAVWAIRTLVGIERACRVEGVRFRPHVIFGASGGMLGAVRYVTGRSPEGPTPTPDPRLEELIAQTEKDGLEELVQRLCSRDIPAFFVPGLPKVKHRGEILEATWAENFGFPEDPGPPPTRVVPRFRDHPTAPHLVFSPMMVEDGRRLLISNLDLAACTMTFGAETKGGTDARRHFTTTAFQLRDLFGEAAQRELSLLTAVRLSATFPYFMPVSAIPTQPRRRLVDAGYYDNYGVSLAARWLEHALEDEARRSWLESEVSRVVVVQIRDGVLDLTRPMKKVVAERGTPGWLGRLLEGITGPLAAVLRFREASQLFGNDDRLADVLADLNRIRPGFATTVSFELGVEASLSWALSAEEKKAIRDFQTSATFRDRCQELVRLLRAPGSGSPDTVA